ncbi:hypothetical protein LINPERPRIM_LOCUS26456 [Linum perenne]
MEEDLRCLLQILAFAQL